MDRLQNGHEPSWRLLDTYLQQIEIHLEEVELEIQLKDPKRPFLVDLW